jgi:hypothetical protein
VVTTPAEGTAYRFSAWVRSDTTGGRVKLRVREYLNGVRIGAFGYFSNTVDLSPEWAELTLDYAAQRAGSTLDLQVEDVPPHGTDAFSVDNVSICVVTGASAFRSALAEADPVAPAVQPLRPVLTPNPMRTQGVIGLATSRPGALQLDVFDPSGRRVRRLALAETPGGWHELAMDGRSDDGSTLSSGIYFYRIVSVDGIAKGRFVLLR